MLIPYNWITSELLEIDEGISLTLLIFLTLIFNNNDDNNNNDNNNTYIAPISALKIKILKKKTKNTKTAKSAWTYQQTILPTLNYKNYLDYLNRRKTASW